MAKSEWIYDSSYQSYYYLTSEGSYARNTWVGDYYLKSNGKMAVSERTPDGYQVDGLGRVGKIRKKEKENEKMGLFTDSLKVSSGLTLGHAATKIGIQKHCQQLRRAATKFKIIKLDF